MRLEAGVDAAFVNWIRPLLNEYRYDAECLEELGLKFIRHRAREHAERVPPPSDIKEAFSAMKSARKEFVRESEELREKALEVDETMAAKRRFEPREETNPTDPHDMILFYHKESRHVLFSFYQTHFLIATAVCF